MSGDHSLYVLTLTKNGVSFHRHPQEDIGPILPEDVKLAKMIAADIIAQLPANLPEAVRYDELDARLQTHRHQEFLARRYMVVDASEASSSDESDDNPQGRQKYLRRYLRELDHALCDLLQDRNKQDHTVTLRLEGDPDICALYRSITAYPHVEVSSQNP